MDEILREERCITAWVASSKPPSAPDYALGSLTECLGDDPPVLLEEGSVALPDVVPLHS